MIRNCRVCGKEYKQGRNGSLMCSACDTGRYRKRNREFVSTLRSSQPCMSCGESNPTVLEFHHTAGTKEYRPKLHNYSLERLKNELSLCTLVCANCHLRIHAGEISCPPALSFDE